MQQITSRQLRLAGAAGDTGDTGSGSRVADYASPSTIVVRAVRSADGAGERVQEPQVLQRLLLRPQPQGDWPFRRIRVLRESFGE